MRFHRCLLASALFVGVAATGLVPGLGVATAGAATTSNGAALHSLGATRPTQRIAPRTVAVTSATTVATLPTTVDLRKWAVTPGYQGSLASCVAWTVDYSMLGWYSRFQGLVGQPFAPMYTYAQLATSGNVGILPTAALTLAATQGNDTRAHYPQGDTDWKSQPTVAQHTNAARFRIKGYTTLFVGANQAGAITQLKQALTSNHPVAVDIAVRAGFDNLGASASATDDDITSATRGYHEVLALGYDAAGLIIENSWGTAWAGDGFGRLSWRVVQHDVWEAETISGFATLPAPPTVTTPATSHATVTTPSATTRPYRFRWTGAAGASGAITHYEAYVQMDGGALTAVHLASPLATSFTINARNGHHYRVAVRAVTASRVGVLGYGAVFVA